MLAIIMLLSGLTVAVLRGTQNHQVLDLTAARLAALVEAGLAQATATDEIIVLAVADRGTFPETATRRALILLRDRDNLPVRDWQHLPPGLVLALETDEESLSQEETLRIDHGEIVADVWPLVYLLPNGQTRRGPLMLSETTRFTLIRGDGLRDATGRFRVLPGEDPEAIHVEIFPLTARVQLTREAP